MCVPQSVGGDGHDAFGTLLRGKPRGVLQGLVRQGRQMEARLVRVAEPGAAGHGQHLKQGKQQRFKDFLNQGRGNRWGYWTLPCRKVKSMQMWSFGRDDLLLITASYLITVFTNIPHRLKCVQNFSRKLINFHSLLIPPTSYSPFVLIKASRSANSYWIYL